VEFEKVFIALAEIGVAIAGFSGVVAVFGARSEGQWTPDDRLRLAFLLTCSMTVVFFSLLPFAMAALHVPAKVVWRAASGLLAIWLILADVIAFRSAARVRRKFHSESRPWLKWLVRIGDAAAVGALLYNAIWMADAGLLLFALLWLLLQSVIMFTELLGFTVRHADK
jgi:hypothetical protein